MLKIKLLQFPCTQFIPYLNVPAPFCVLLYIELAISFAIGRKCMVNFRNQRPWHHNADYTIIMSRTLKVTGTHIMYDRGAWFLRVIMSSSHALCCSTSAKKQSMTLIFFPLLLDLGFVTSRIIEVLASIILDITKTSSNNNCLWVACIGGGIV